MYLGVDVGGTNLAAGLTDEGGHIRYKTSVHVEKAWSPEEITAQLVLLCRRTAEEANTPWDQIEAVGMGVPGQVDAKAGVVVHSPNVNFRNTPLRALVQQGVDRPVYLENDANCAAIGEYWAGAAKGHDPAVVITLGTGIGGGMVAGGKLYTGCAGGGMEVGHMVTRPGGRQCGCGNLGCWETYGSATGLIRTTREAMAEHPESALWRLCGGDTEKVEGRTPFQAAVEGDATALAVVDTYVHHLAEGLVNVVNLAQPEMICLGGGVSAAPEHLLLEPLRKLVRQGAFDKIHAAHIVRAALGNDAGIVGAAMLCRGE